MWEGIIRQKGEYNLIFPHLFKECPYIENKIFTLYRNTYQKKFVSINVFPYSILTLKISTYQNPSNLHALYFTIRELWNEKTRYLVHDDSE